MSQPTSLDTTIQIRAAALKVLWGFLGLTGVAALLWNGWMALDKESLPSTWTWGTVYAAGLRVLILEVVIALVVFALCHVRAYWHARAGNVCPRAK